MNIVNVGYDSTNYYLLGSGNTRLLVDIGWPGTMPKFAAAFKRKGIDLHEVRYMLATHYHPDHAGLAQALKGLGARLIVMEGQAAALAAFKQYAKAGSPSLEIRQDDNVALTFAKSRAFLLRLGIEGQIIPTPGHSDDSVSVVLDGGIAFTGDLPPPGFAAEEQSDALNESWERLRACGVTTIYPGHGPARQV